MKQSAEDFDRANERRAKTGLKKYDDQVARTLPTQLIEAYRKTPKSTNQVLHVYKMVDRAAKKPVFDIDHEFGIPSADDPPHRHKTQMQANIARAEREWLKANPPKPKEVPKLDPIAQLEAELAGGGGAKGKGGGGSDTD